MKKKKDYMDIFQLIRANREAELAAYSENVIEVPEERRWDYAISENYTNYQDGFLWQDEKPYRGMPMIIYNGKVLYLHRACSIFEMNEDEDEKLMLFDRYGHKYVFVVKKAEKELESNPSYWEFIKKVKKYDSKLKRCTYPIL